MWRRVLNGVATLLVLAACDSSEPASSDTRAATATETIGSPVPEPSPTASTTTSTTSLVAAPVPRCHDVVQLTGTLLNADAPRLGPTQNLPDHVIEAANQLGAQHPDVFGGRWIDRDHGGVAFAATARHLELAQQLLDQVGPEWRVIAVLAPRTFDQGMELMQRVQTLQLNAPDGPVFGWGYSEATGFVSLNVELYTSEVVEELVAALGTDGYCIDGADPSTTVPPGPQPETGENWRLLLDEPGAGAPYATAFAATDEQLDALWVQLGTAAPRPQIDFTQEAVVWFGPAVSGSCPDIRLDGVLIDLEARLVVPDIVELGGAKFCTSDANPHAYVVAIPLRALPARPFSVEVMLNACARIPGVCKEQRTDVD